MIAAAAAETWTWFAWSAMTVAGVVLTGLYCGMESGIYSLNKLRLDLHAEAGWQSAKLLKRMLRNYNNLLAVLLIGTNLSSYAATFAVSAMFAQGGAGEMTGWYTIATATPLLFIFGESVPKNVFHRLAERLVHRLSWLLEVSSVLFNASLVCPLVRGFSWMLLRLMPASRRAGPHLRHDGLAAIVAEGRASGVLTHFQTVMADRVMKIAQVHLADVMVPLASAVTAPRDVTRAGLLERIDEHNYSRLPLLTGEGQVAGILDLYSVMFQADDAPPAHGAVEPLALPAETPVTDALYRMQREKATMVVVAGPQGRHVGIVTIKDLVEEIVGELEAW